MSGENEKCIEIFTENNQLLDKIMNLMSEKEDITTEEIIEKIKENFPEDSSKFLSKLEDVFGQEYINLIDRIRSSVTTLKLVGDDVNIQATILKQANGQLVLFYQTNRNRIEEILGLGVSDLIPNLEFVDRNIIDALPVLTAEELQKIRGILNKDRVSVIENETKLVQLKLVFRELENIFKNNQWINEITLTGPHAGGNSQYGIRIKFDDSIEGLYDEVIEQVKKVLDNIGLEEETFGRKGIQKNTIHDGSFWITSNICDTEKLKIKE